MSNLCNLKKGRRVWGWMVCGVLFSFVGLPWQVTWGQTNYYVASNGNDANDGRSTASPFQSLAKVNSLSLRAGDGILFRRGDTFQGTLLIRQSGSANAPIVVDAYGNGNKPVLAGSVSVSGWSSSGGNIWQASCPTCGSRVSGVYSNGSPLPLGRYPNLNTANKGYLTVQSHSGKTQLISQQGLSTNWTGGEVVVRPQKWIIDRAAITAQNGNTLTISNSSIYDISDGWGFFIQNHPATLDQSGEWYYNPATKIIQLYSQNNPSGQTITATAFDEAIRIENAAYVTIQNVTITQARVTNLYAINASNLTVSANDITRAGEDAIRIDGSGSNVLVQNNILYNANNNGFTISPYQNLTFRGNTVRNVGLTRGRSRSGDGQSIAFLAHTTANTLIENNIIDSIGYHGINFWINSTIQRNTVSNYCLTKSDGGGLYIRNGNKQSMGGINILSNIVYNAVGSPEGAPYDAYSGANGIYLDDCMQNATVQGNTVFNCTGIGIYLHATNNITLQGNTSFNNGEGQLMIGSNHGMCLARTNQLRDNIFVSKPANQLVARYESDQDDLTSYGTFDNNYYVRPFNDVSTIRAVNKSGSSVVGNDLALSEWQSRYQKDPNSKSSPVTYKSSTITGTGASRLNNTFTTNAENWSSWSSYGNGNVAQVAGSQSSTSPLDGGSLQVSFPTNSGRSDSYAIVTNNIGAVGRAKTYRLQFDAVALGTNKRLEVYIRQQNAPWQDISTRSILSVGPTRQHYDLNLTSTADEANTFVTFQVFEDGKTIWFDNVSLQEVGAAKVANTFTANSEGWSTWSLYGNSQVSQLPSGQLDGGSLQVNFPTSSGRSDSYAIVTNYINAVVRTRTYRVQFDAIASGAGKRLLVYLRQRDSPWQDVSARTTLTIGTTRQKYDLTLTATADEANTFALFQVDEDGKTVWFDNVTIQEVTAGAQRLSNTFTSGTEGWSSWGPYGNSQAIQTIGGQASTGQLDGGSLRISFPSSSGRSDSYVLATNYIGTVNNARSYRIQFDAIASGANKRLQIYIRQRDSPWQDLAIRTTLLIGTTRQSYEAILTATADQANTLAIFQVDEDGKTLWIDNVRMQEVTTTQKNPDDYIRLVYNATSQNSNVSLTGTYRDAKNQVYSGQITLTPFTSAVLFKEEAGGRQSADASESLQNNGSRKSEFRIVYPIPTYDEFMFVADDEVQTMQVIDLMGRDRLKRQDIHQGQSLLFGSELPAGQYLLHVRYSDGSQRVEKLLKVGR
ncbi:right-handed parallel beta-helix repeat-containing protein [Spirosoma sp. BT702]|uniref:Right-handed parallel beta-helix repeat-containing protein n=1 Tax=Spirosoma profusum TaxID=2771354 RepID=A0A927AQX6_9BACT|nr:right-handed parallel beta-helix repeat-containing protein [Spirosoma profusum]MBD2701413.1 right-handed parallel beta-helix repeat-containing protein [Spirosoma profusum]